MPLFVSNYQEYSGVNYGHFVGVVEGISEYM
jgi:hypothetical protein